MTDIDLDKFRSGGCIVLSGRDRGEHARSELLVDMLDKNDEPVLVRVPLDMASINTSFFLGLFGPSVRACGDRAAFLAKYQFECNDSIREDIDTGISRALVSAPLGGLL